MCDVLVGFHDNHFAWSVLDQFGNFEVSELDTYNG